MTRAELVRAALRVNAAAGEKVMLAVLADLTGDAAVGDAALGAVTASKAMLGRAAGCSDAQAGRRVAGLAARGHLTVEPGVNASAPRRLILHPDGRGTVLGNVRRAEVARRRALDLPASGGWRRPWMALGFAEAAAVARAAGRDARDAVLPASVLRAVLTFSSFAKASEDRGV